MSLINKQYNSPIKLYSQQNIQEVLDKEKRMLDNGAIGIDFHHLTKPKNLAESAVLRMLEEEENQKNKKFKRVAWPPPPEDTYINEIEQQTPTKNPEQPLHQTNYNSGPTSQANLISTSPPASRIENNISPKGWAPVQSSVQTQPQPYFQQHQQQNQQPFQQAPTPTPLYHPIQQPTGLLTLRKEAPVHQQPAPVFSSQPATATYQGGSNMRGDQKWPPASVKAQTEAENRARLELAKGPACRPRKVHKDYSSFFAQHALNSTYPGYRAPPGTQHYFEEPQYPGQSNL